MTPPRSSHVRDVAISGPAAVYRENQFLGAHVDVFPARDHLAYEWGINAFGSVLVTVGEEEVVFRTAGVAQRFFADPAPFVPTDRSSTRVAQWHVDEQLHRTTSGR